MITKEACRKYLRKISSLEKVALKLSPGAGANIKPDTYQDVVSSYAKPGAKPSAQRYTEPPAVRKHRAIEQRAMADPSMQQLQNLLKEYEARSKKEGLTDEEWGDYEKTHGQIAQIFDKYHKYGNPVQDSSDNKNKNSGMMFNAPPMGTPEHAKKRILDRERIRKAWEERIRKDPEAMQAVLERLNKAGYSEKDVDEYFKRGPWLR